MPKVFIPQVGDKIELSSNWNCKIFNESRNRSVFEALGVDVSEQKDSNIDITFLKGTVFKVTRLYVRAPASSYDSITLSVVSSPIKKLAKTKFWVKLWDANNMEFEEKDYSFDSFDCLYDLYQHLILTDGYPNSEFVEKKQKQAYLQKIVDYFYNPEKQISYSVLLDKEVVLGSYYVKSEFKGVYRNKEEIAKEKADVLILLPEETLVTVTLYPALGGMLMRITPVDEIIKIDTDLGYLNQPAMKQNSSPNLGSFLSYDYLYYLNDFKKSDITYLDLALKNKVDFTIGDKIQKINSKRAFNQIMVDFLTPK